MRWAAWANNSSGMAVITPELRMSACVPASTRPRAPVPSTCLHTKNPSAAGASSKVSTAKPGMAPRADCLRKTL